MAKKITKIEPVSKEYQPEVLPPKRVCAYCRVSTDSSEQKTSYASQLSYYSKMIGEKEDWVFAGIYADEARSGTKVAKRDDFQQMLHDCRLGKIDMIITKSFTRFARNTVDSIKAIRELKALGITVYFEKEHINTLSEKSEQLLTIWSSLAQGESESISTNSKWAVTRRFQSGTYIISTPAYGYRNDEDGELVIKKEEAVVVRRIFDEYLSGLGSYVIAQGLVRDGIPTIRGGASWTDGVVQRILLNPVYEGDLLLQKTYSLDVVPFARKTNYGERQQYLISDNHEAVITREEAAVVRQLYEYRRQQANPNATDCMNRYAFSSKIECGECSSRFRRQKIYIGKPYEAIQWGCKQHIHNKVMCSQKAVREDAIKEAFVRLWNRLASNYEAILIPMLASLKSIRSNPEQEQEYQELDNQIQELKRQNHMLSKILTGGDMDSALFIQKRNRIDHELEGAWRRQRMLQEQKMFEKEIAQTEYLITIFRNRPPIIEAYDEELFLLIIERIVVHPDMSLEFWMKNGLNLEEGYRKAV